MTGEFPGPKTKAVLERGIPLFRNGLKFDAEMERAGRRGFRSVRQIVIDKAHGDFIWDMDGNRYEPDANSFFLYFVESDTHGGCVSRA